ncbi:MAG: phosphotransferase family protein [Halioglobus sp.]|nr:phosphotransferase family protein [Halioglobus sp.]
MDSQKLPGSGSPLSAHYISGGASNEIFALERGDVRLALRKPPAKVPAGRNETMLREYRVIHALNGTDVPHPEAIAVCDDTSILGSCFYIMAHVDGFTPMGDLPLPFCNSAALRSAMAYQLVDGIARLGQVDWRAVGLEGFGKPNGFLDRQVDRWFAHLEKIKFRELPGLEEAGAWLRRHTPEHFTPGIIHGDYQFANVMFHRGNKAQLAAIVDWEMATVGDPLLDLAWILMTWPNPDEDRSTGYVDFTGMPSREELMHYYAAHSGLPIENIDYYIVLARFKMACVLEAGYARYVKGGADNPKMAMFGDVVLDMAKKAQQLANSSPLKPTH